MIKFRPHHFLCTYCFIGAGYNLDFIENYREIKAVLDSDDLTKIEVSNSLDNICKQCPNNINGEQCDTESKVQKLDQLHMQALDLQIGDIVTWRQAKSLIKTKISLEVFDSICEKCEWKKLNICKDIIFPNSL